MPPRARAIALSGSGRVRALRPHRNPGVEIVLVAEGTVLWQTEGQVESVPAGSVFFTLPWQQHGSLTETEPGNSLFWVVLPARGIERGNGKRLEFGKVLELPARLERSIGVALESATRHAFPANDAIHFLVPKLVEVARHREPEARYLERAYAVAALVELAALVRSPLEAPERPASELRVERFLDGLAEQCGAAWTLESMAEACGLGRTQFGAIAKRLRGESPLELLSGVRIDAARRLLAQTDDPITDIAMRLGFSSSQYFANTFRAATGFTPTAYRSAKSDSHSAGARRH